MARIYLDARTNTDHLDGIARYARGLTAELARQAPHHDFVVLRHRSNVSPLLEEEPKNLEQLYVDSPIDSAQNFFLGHRALAAALARGGAPDLYHSLFHVLPLKTRRLLPQTPIVTTAHSFVALDRLNTAPGRLQGRTRQAFYRLAIPYSLRNSDQVIAVSDPVKRRAYDFVDDHRLTTIAHGVEPVFFRAPPPPSGEFAELLNPDRPYIVAIGNDRAYKNLIRLVEAFSDMLERGFPARLVLIGECRGLATQVAHTPVSEWITLTDRLTDETLRRILAHARIFVFPSLAEGFGLPLLEAMAMGVPSLVADVEPMRSIAEQAALYFPPTDILELSHLMKRVLTDDGLADRLASRGRRRAGQFRWSDTASQTLAIYDRLLTEGRTLPSTPQRKYLFENFLG